MKIYTVVYRRPGFATNLRCTVQAYDEDDALLQFAEKVRVRVVRPRVYKGRV